MVWRERGHVGRRCECGMVYLDQAHRDPAAGVPADLHGEGFYSLSTGLRVDWVERFSPGRRLLEVGPGAGYLLAEARRRGFQVSGVDPNPASVRRIRERLGIEVEEATIETSALPDASFDVVVHVDLLGHFPDPVLALRAMARRLAPGGVLCFEVGATGGVSPLWYRGQGHVGFPAHLWLHSQESVRRILARAGLRTIGLRRYGLAPSFALILARRAAGPLGRIIAGMPREPAPDGLPPAQNAPHRLYERLVSALRYGAGRYAPDVGPQTLLIAARPEDG